MGTPIAITREYERFHDELGRLDATQGRTKLWDSIVEAVNMIETFEAQSAPAAQPSTPVVKRIFLLTDGQDNASQQSPWQVAQLLQQRGIMLDAIPLADDSSQLRAMCHASGGLCFDVQSQTQGIALFEREATLHLPYRECASEQPPVISDLLSFDALVRSSPASNVQVTDIKSKVSANVYAPVLSAAQATERVKAAPQGSSTGTGGGNAKRVLKEYANMYKDPLPGWSVFMTADNVLSWKMVMTDLPAPYEGGAWLLTVDFPAAYPLQAPKVKFVTPIYHCNISNDGKICMDILMDRWSPALSLATVQEAIRAMLLQPNADDPLDAFKGQLCRDDPMAYGVEAAKHTVTHASRSLLELGQEYNLL